MIGFLLKGVWDVGLAVHEGEKLASIENSNNEIIESLATQTTMLSGLQTSMDEQSFLLAGLQTSMSVMGVASIASLGVSGLSLYKINQVSKEIKNLSSQIDNGFIDMKYFISEEMKALIKHQEKVKLSEAYEYYQKALQILQRSLIISDLELKKYSLFKAMEHFDKALIIYDSQKKFQDLSSAGHLRQLEITMIIEALKAELYMMMGEVTAGKNHYSDLLNRVNSELTQISNNACRDTIDLILLDTFLLKNNDIKLIEQKLRSKC